MLLTYKTGTSRGKDTYGYSLVTLTGEDGKKFRTCGGGYDMLGTVTAEALEYYFPKRLLALHRRAEHFTQEGKRGGQTRRAMLTRPTGEKTLAPTWDYKKHSYGLAAHYGKTQRDIKRVSLDGATGFSNVRAIAKRLGVGIREVYDKSNPRKWKRIGLEFIDTKKGDKTC